MQRSSFTWNKTECRPQQYCFKYHMDTRFLFYSYSFRDCSWVAETYKQKLRKNQLNSVFDFDALIASALW